LSAQASRITGRANLLHLCCEGRALLESAWYQLLHIQKQYMGVTPLPDIIVLSKKLRPLLAQVDSFYSDCLLRFPVAVVVGDRSREHYQLETIHYEPLSNLMKPELTVLRDTNDIISWAIRSIFNHFEWRKARLDEYIGQYERPTHSKYTSAVSIHVFLSKLQGAARRTNRLVSSAYARLHPPTTGFLLEPYPTYLIKGCVGRLFVNAPDSKRDTILQLLSKRMDCCPADLTLWQRGRHILEHDFVSAIFPLFVNHHYNISLEMSWTRTGVVSGQKCLLLYTHNRQVITLEQAVRNQLGLVHISHPFMHGNIPYDEQESYPIFVVLRLGALPNAVSTIQLDGVNDTQHVHVLSNSLP